METKMTKAKLVRFDGVDHQERRPGVVLTSLVDGDTGPPRSPAVSLNLPRLVR